MVAHEIPEHIEVDGVRRSTCNSEGRLIHHTQEGIENFWKWFGGSQVVDEDGRPIVAYHGSKTPEGITVFMPGGAINSRLCGDAYGVASYFTTSKGEATHYAHDEGAVFPVYLRGHFLNVDLPLSADQAAHLTDFAHAALLPSDKARFECGRRTREFEDVEMARDFFDAQYKNWEHFGDGMDRARPEVRADQGKYQVDYTDFDASVAIRTGEDAFTLLRAVGFDALPSMRMDGLMMRREGGQIWVVMHRPRGNVKSALGNWGTFDPANPDIRHAEQEAFIQPARRRAPSIGM